MDISEMQHRYLHDSVFHALVDSMLSHLKQGHCSAYEMRDACTLALNKFAMAKPPEPIPVSGDLAEIRDNLRDYQAIKEAETDSFNAANAIALQRIKTEENL